MNHKGSAIVSGLLTGFILLMIAIGSFFVLMVTLNDVRVNRAYIAMGIALICQLVILLSGGIFAAKASTFLIAKLNGKKILAIFLAVFAGTLVGSLLSFVSIIASILLAGIR